jgi:hypothetical protein
MEMLASQHQDLRAELLGVRVEVVILKYGNIFSCPNILLSLVRRQIGNFSAVMVSKGIHHRPVDTGGESVFRHRKTRTNLKDRWSGRTRRTEKLLGFTLVTFNGPNWINY